MYTAFRALLFAGMAMLTTSGSSREGLPVQTASFAGATQNPALSVMTYNIKGLPWPIALGRGEAMGRIAGRLAAMRRAGRQPHIVLLQEAFTAEAMALAGRAGYRHVAFGPDAALRTATATQPADIAYLRSARLDRGEAMGKQTGSGLMILSDYPILGTARMAFPDFACAGFDCLANKGVLIAHLAVPGAGRVSIVNTHLNARTAAMVPVARSQQAFARQVGLAAGFVARHVPRGQALILGGDMNIGSDPLRQGAFFAGFTRSGLPFVTPGLGGARRALEQGGLPDMGTRHDLIQAARHGKDWLFARDGSGAPMAVLQAQVPFGTEAGGEPLSDHFGYVINYGPAKRRDHEPIHFASRDVMAGPAGGQR